MSTNRFFTQHERVLHPLEFFADCLIANRSECAFARRGTLFVRLTGPLPAPGEFEPGVFGLTFGHPKPPAPSLWCMDRLALISTLEVRFVPSLCSFPPSAHVNADGSCRHKKTVSPRTVPLDTSRVNGPCSAMLFSTISGMSLGTFLSGSKKTLPPRNVPAETSRHLKERRRVSALLIRISYFLFLISYFLCTVSRFFLSLTTT